ncbi:uncharacterized protein LOC132406661 [Hypanus sabinus]|uniref:uncharacterized protein LOC132406661 n=1 Tax=Hypanus sabinus TaxID=79690 RepID=UPI0028C441EC|nr:uncharacterized protein LOC132406661 [Hypanus sabinus]
MAVGGAVLIRSAEDGARKSCAGGDGRRLGGSMDSASVAVRSLLVCAGSARLSRAAPWKSIAGVFPSADGVGCSKSGKKEAMVLPTEIPAVLERHREDILKEFRTWFNQLDAKLDRINARVDDHAEHLSRIDSTSEDLKRRIEYLETLSSSLEEKNSKLLSKMVDLESRSRRCNLRILGLPEATEQGPLVKYFSDFLCEIFGKEFLPNPPEFERAHRVYISSAIPGSRPRPVILCFHQYQVKNCLILEARRRGTFAFQNSVIHFVEDFAPQVLKMCAEFKGVLSSNIHFNFFFKPSTLDKAFLIWKTKGIKNS